MEVKQIPEQIKYLGFGLLFIVVSGIILNLLLNVADIEFQTKWLEYLWNLSLYSCFMVIVINENMDRTKKKVLFIFLIGTILLSYFMIPRLSAGNVTLGSMSFMMLLYNIIFISILYSISKLNFHCLFIILVNIIIAIGLLTSIYIINTFLIFSHSTTLTYFFSIGFILYIIFTMRLNLFKNNNLYILFIIIGNIVTIFLYFFILIFHINNNVSLNPGLIIFISSMQPLFYWLGINFILMED